MSGWTLRLADRADQDIEEVLAWTLAHFGPLQLDAYTDIINAALEALTAGPHLPDVRKCPELGAGIGTNSIAHAKLLSSPTQRTAMLSVTVSPKFQVVIPQAVRAQLGIQPGQRLQVLAHGQSIELLPLERARELRGFLPGLDTTVPRDEDRV